MSQLNIARFGPRTIRADAYKVTDADTSAVYNLTNLAWVETYDDTEYVTSAGIAFRQDDAGECKRARDAYEANERSIRLAAEELTESKDKEATPAA